jgi:hypothetical protein
MPGIATKFITAELVHARLKKAGAPEARFFEDPALRPFTFLGAAGSAWADVMAGRAEVGDNPPNSPYARVWINLLPIFGGQQAGPGGAPPGITGVCRPLRQILSVLDRLQDVINNEATLDLIGMIDDLKDLKTQINDIKKSVQQLATIRTKIGKAIFTSSPKPRVAPSAQWFPRDALRGSRTGQFARDLIHEAEAANDDRFRAYALGWTISYAVELCGQGFVNSVTGAPYRNHWWRTRWAANYVDTWVYGFYRLGGGAKVNAPSNGIPSPLYANWPNLKEGRLQDKIAVGGISVDPLLDAYRDAKPLPAFLPLDFVAFWRKVYQMTYGSTPPEADDPGVQSAYALLWLILWIQTSNEALPAIAADQANPPDNCGSRPDWVAVDGSVAVGGTPISPPPDPPKPKPSVAEIVSAVLLALLGAVEIITGNVVGGILTIVAAVELAKDGANVDWDALRCHLGWTRVFLNNLVSTFHEMMKLTGLGYPFTNELAHDALLRQLTSEIKPGDAALNTCFSRPLDGKFPFGRWAATKSDWVNFPTNPPTPLETPSKTSYPIPGIFPFHFVDGLQFVPGAKPTDPPLPPLQVNGLFTASGRPVPLVRDEQAWKSRRAALNEGAAWRILFGNAVDVALDLIASDPKQRLDWDLDADPGFGHPTWLLPSASAPRSSLVPE